MFDDGFFGGVVDRGRKNSRGVFEGFLNQKGTRGTMHAGNIEFGDNG